MKPPFPSARTASAARRKGRPPTLNRWFGTLRSRMRRLVRRAYSFSKSVERHLDAIHLFQELRTVTTSSLSDEAGYSVIDEVALE
jgi:hypothetical protein